MGINPSQLFAPASRVPGSVLLETQRPDPRDRHSYLLKDPFKILSSSRAGDVGPILEEAGEWQARGHPVAGFVSYEAGFSLDEAFAARTGPHRDPRKAGFPLLWFGVYGGYLRFDHQTGKWSAGGPSVPGWPAPGPDPDGPSGAPIDPRFSLSEAEHSRKVEAIRRAIARGDVYQANLTGTFSFPFPDDPYALYLKLRGAQPVRYGAFLRTDAGCVVSQSPELFFRVRGNRIETRPMKGTAPRGLTDAEDRKAAAGLRSDPKNRAENVMIVDLLRNDLGKVCLPGTVRASRLFEVQRLRTVLQMVSTVTGTLPPGTTPASLFKALFPCGSVTGAPKIASMELLRRLESGPRGVYTGAIGILLPGGDMSFSVAIRTVVVADGRAEAGAGGGIVWDSKPSEEYREACLKGRYLAEPPLDFELIETLLWSPGTGFRFLPDHLSRLSSSARYFGFRFRREAVMSALESAVRERRPGGPAKIRLLLGPGGQPSVEVAPLPAAAPQPSPLRLAISKIAVDSRDPFVRHKTTNRAWRDEELRRAREAGFDEVLFLNERGELTEGAISNLFAGIGGRLVTPPAACGLLEGIYRKRMLADRSLGIVERALRPEDLRRAESMFLTNSVRGMRAAVPPAEVAHRL